MQNHPVTAYIALGSNLRDREKAIRAALRELDSAPDTHVIQVSRLMENAAIGGPTDSPDFFNAAAEIRTSLEPHDLMRRLLEIEQKLGRIRREKWAPRSIDLDLLLYGDEVISSDNLTVPHPLMHTRRFVLEPLAEIAPEVLHPILGVSIATLLAEISFH